MIHRWLIILILLCAPNLVRAEAVVADLSANFVAVSAGFNGTELIVFGSLETPADVAVVIEGPLSRATLWTKTRNMGIWLNDNPVVFEPVPSFYAIATSQPITKIADANVIEEKGLSLAQQPFLRQQSSLHTLMYGALLQVKQDQNLYQEQPIGVKLLANQLFRADFELPAAMPMGAYKAHIYLLRDGKITAAQTLELKVAQVGVEAAIYNMAHKNPLAYGMLALLIAVSLGGGASFIFRRLG